MPIGIDRYVHIPGIYGVIVLRQSRYVDMECAY
jgi:hypothetical protein